MLVTNTCSYHKTKLSIEDLNLGEIIVNVQLSDSRLLRHILKDHKNGQNVLVDFLH